MKRETEKRECNSLSHDQNEQATGTALKAKPAVGIKQRGQEKVSRIPIKVIPTEKPERKPSWIRVRLPANNEASRIKSLLRKQKLHTVCEEAACPNLPECFGGGTATFMIMGDICTRRCPFCDVAHGKPNALDPQEPMHLAEAVSNLDLKYVVVTSVDRDDLRDGGAGHFVACINAIREQNPQTKIEILVPDFRGRMDVALKLMEQSPPDVFNHNLESVPRLYKAIRPGSDYQWSLSLLKRFKDYHPNTPTKSGLMVGLGETLDEIKEVMADLREHDVNMITIGQYLQPSKFHLPVDRYVHPDEFADLQTKGEQMGFDSVASGPMVRSSYHADQQAKEIVG